ncbi:vacuolar protein sorting-associated protein 18 homolog [Molossus molossus]|uniref:Vacuolar protein sorting-associated protein 18 homolog n=2 Tax=Molossus molossus TaxID=27622 RepID=A0A7J8K3J6_MOLMO|nr:vacuolar protein sorting-associated protein 18 homolog [Molossus molossus]KAF6503411.1 VPS18 core subunit of CORVET and HOPS complexes [Molossus molossus]
MASILDEYEDSLSRSAVLQPGCPSVGIPHSGYVNAQLEKEVPIFTKQRIDFTPSERITSLVVSCNQLCMSLGKDTLLRIDLGKANEPNHMELGRKDDAKVHKMFLDHTGFHLLIALSSTEVLYVNRNGQKVRLLARWKGQLVESVGWNKAQGTESSTGPILVGTAQGHIFEAELSASEGGLFGPAPDLYFRPLYVLNEEGGPAPVCSLEAERGPDGRIFVIATTRQRLFQFIGRAAEGTETQGFLGLFAAYTDHPPPFREFPSSLGYSELAFYTPKLRSAPRAFAWMMGDGVLYGALDNGRPDSLLSEERVWEYPEGVGPGASPPLAIVLTQFHFLLLLADRVEAVCTLTGQVVLRDHFLEKFGPLKHMVKDSSTGHLWAYTERAVFRYHVQREARDVWRTYLDMNRFDLAKEYCRERPDCLDTVLAREAEFCFNQRRYLESARCYALTQSYFEEIALKFLEARQEDALVEFLQRKLASLKPAERTQATLLTTWLTELYLSRLGALQGDPEALNLYWETRERFRAFLSSPRHKEWLFASRASIHELLASHGDTEHMVYFAVIMQDYERVVAYHCQHEAYEEALAVLARHRDPQLFYKFSPILIRHIPRQLVDAWIEMGSRLDARQLIPALVNYSQGGEAQQVSQAIRYMEFCVNVLGETEQAIHNYLLSLYARGQPASLLAYLEHAGASPHRVHYDLKYALRLCAEHGHHRACVHVYKVLELYEEAVDLALQVDVDLAKQCADLPEEDEELRKKLWLKIARHVVQEEEDVQTAMACLASCPLLKIEDVLPFFPDFVTIDHFKEAICSSLKAYNHHIQELQREMEEATASAQRIRRDLQELRGRYGTVEPQDKCATCDFPLLNRPFYLFLCGHMFHADCLLQAVRPGLPAYKQARLEELQRKLGAAPPPTKGSARAKEAEGGAAAGGPSREQLKADLDELVAAECVYCGELMIRSIDRPFIDPQRYEEEHLSWL